MAYDVEIKKTPGIIEEKIIHVVEHRPLKNPDIELTTTGTYKVEVAGTHEETRKWTVDSNTWAYKLFKKRVSPTSLGIGKIVKAMFDAYKNMTQKDEYTPEKCAEINRELDEYDQEKRDFKKVARFRDAAGSKKEISINDIPQERLEEMLKK